MKELHSIFSDAVTNWPSDRINQAQAGFNEEGKCCIGARLAMIIIPDYYGNDNFDHDGTPWYLIGVDEWIKTAGGNRLHAILLLRQAGASHNPFGIEQWKESPEKVLDNLKEIEELPPLTDQDFSWCRLDDIHLKDENLSGSKLIYSSIKHSILENSDFSNCDLEGANLSDTVISYCNFKNSIFRFTNTQSAKISNCTF